MALHRLTRIVMGVPNVAEVSSYYREFGLSPASEPHHFATVDGGEQLRIVPAVSRRLVQLGVGTDDLDDLGRISSALDRLGVACTRADTSLTAVDPGTGVSVRVEIDDRIVQKPATEPVYNAPGVLGRPGTRADGILRQEGVRPRKLGQFGSAPPTRTLRRDSSSTGWASKSVTPFPVWPHSCGARPTTTTSWFSRLRCRSCTTPRGRSTTSTMWDAGRPRCSSRPGSAHLGPRAPLHWIELLLVPEGSRRQFQRVLLRHGLHRRRCAPETRRVGRIELAVFVGSTAPAVLPRPRGSRRDDDRSS